MKKLLCVLMFGMVFGQDAITTREYILEANGPATINVADWIGSQFNGYYEIIWIATTSDENLYPTTFEDCEDPCEGDPSDCCETYYDCNSWKVRIHYSDYSMEDNSYYNEITGMCEKRLLNKQIIVNELNSEIEITYHENVYDVSLILFISGRFDNSDTGLQGDMNDDDSLDVMDVVMLVDVIINGGVGDVGNLLNIVRG